MRIQVQVRSERTHVYPGKNGPVKQQILTLLDVDDTDALLNTLDYILTDEEVQQHSGKLKGKNIELAVTSMEMGFDKRLRARGRIISV